MVAKVGISAVVTLFDDYSQAYFKPTIRRSPLNIAIQTGIVMFSQFEAYGIDFDTGECFKVA